VCTGTVLPFVQNSLPGTFTLPIWSSHSDFFLLYKVLT
jgi:hypothetical protein